MVDLTDSSDTAPAQSTTYKIMGARTYVFAAVCFLAVFVYFFLQIRASSVLVQFNNCVLGADVAGYYQGLIEGNWGVFRIRKHALAVVSVAALAVPLGQAGLPLTLAIPAALSAVVALGALALFFLLRLHRLSSVTSLAAVFAMLSTFGTLTVFSVVETYGVTFAAAAVAMLIFMALARLADNRPLISALSAGVVGAAVGWANLPAVAFVLLYTGFAWSTFDGDLRRKCILLLVLPIAVAALLALVPSVYADAGKGFAWQREYVERYASLWNFVTPGILLQYLSSFWVFSFVSPLETVRSIYSTSDFTVLAGSPLKLVAWIAVIGTLAFGTGRALWRRETRFPAAAALLTAAGLFMFYLYFNPLEAVLYSSQWTLALFFAAALGYAGLRFSFGIFAVLFALLFTVNGSLLSDPRSADPSWCLSAPPTPAL